MSNDRPDAAPKVADEPDEAPDTGAPPTHDGAGVEVTQSEPNTFEPEEDPDTHA